MVEGREKREKREGKGGRKDEENRVCEVELG